ncbi:MAG: hypothetical protein WA063_05230 [Minisyncoccia bacterium]
MDNKKAEIIKKLKLVPTGVVYPLCIYKNGSLVYVKYEDGSEYKYKDENLIYGKYADGNEFNSKYENGKLIYKKYTYGGEYNAKYENGELVYEKYGDGRYIIDDVEYIGEKQK